jgi:methionyl-tRNA formyltransferase
MRALLLGASADRLAETVAASGDQPVCIADRITAAFVADGSFDLLVSYGYRFRLPVEVLDFFPDRAINLHISMLPFNRGADPNLWSFLEQTPKGVTIHYIDQGLDTGDILAQAEVEMSAGETLATSYRRLSVAVEELFAKWWQPFRAGRAPRRPQRGSGSFHRAADKVAFDGLLTEGWDTPVAAIEGAARYSRRS